MTGVVLPGFTEFLTALDTRPIVGLTSATRQALIPAKTKKNPAKPNKTQYNPVKVSKTH